MKYCISFSLLRGGYVLSWRLIVDLYKDPAPFTNYRGETVDLNKMRRDCIKFTGKTMSDTLLWHWIVATDWGTSEPRLFDEDMGIFGSNPLRRCPWPERLSILKPDSEKPRVFVAGRNHLSLTTPGNEKDFDLVRPILEKYGLPEPRWSSASSMGRFWGDFFGAETYLDNPRDVPSLIIATGTMRLYTQTEGNTFGCEDTLRDFAGQWATPIEFIRFR